MKKNIKLIPLFLFLFVFQLLYFLSTIYTEKIDHMFLILAVFMVLICILLYCVLSDVLKKSNAEMELAFLQKQKQLKQEQDYSLQIRRQDTRDFQVKTVQGLQDFQIFLEQGEYEQADTAIRNLNQTFQKKRFILTVRITCCRQSWKGNGFVQNRNISRYPTRSFYRKRFPLIRLT